MRWLFNKVVLSILVVGLVSAAGVWWWHRSAAPADSFRTAAVKRGDVESAISATGTVEPEEVIDVGAQVAGLIDKFGADPEKADRFVDYGTHVKEGMLLAHVDDSLYAADDQNARAAVDEANANVARAVADLGQMKAKLVEAQRDWDRAQKIGPSDALSENDYDMYQANFETAQANVGVDEAAVSQAKSAVTEAEAQAKKSKKNLDYCTILSPVDGVIIDRRVNIGQTVVSSLSAPSLFLLAKDLKKMQVWASVNEADVGNIYSGQPVTFTVDAFPGETFLGKVNKVRYNAVMTQNVVTYTVEILTDNSSGRLIPYLTANVQFQIARRKDALLVPSAALHWSPQETQVAPDVRERNASAQASAIHHGSHADGSPSESSDSDQSPPPNASPTTGPTTSTAQAHGTVHYEHGLVWVRSGNFVSPIEVRAGVSDGANTEVIPADSATLPEGTPVIVGDAIVDAGGAGANPFLPQFGKIFGRRGGGR
jgi:HlyD family secretion protein